ncbi:MAG: flagellin [Nitrospinota bacterium]
MGIRINQNIQSLQALRNLRNTQEALTRNAEQLSTASQINRGADNPSGLIASENLRAQVAGLGEEIQGRQNQANQIRVEDVRFDEVLTQLRSVRGQALQSLNTGAGDATTRAAGQASAQSSLQGIRQALQGSRAEELDLDTTQLNSALNDLQGIDLTTAEGAAQALGRVDQAIEQVATFRGQLGARQSNELEPEARNLEVQAENLRASESAIRDTDFAEAAVAFTRNQIRQSTGLAALRQSNQNTQQAAGLVSNSRGGRVNTIA